MTTYLGKSCSFCLPRMPFVNCRQFMYLVISLLVLRAGYGIWLYQFMIIAYLFTLHMQFISTRIFYLLVVPLVMPYQNSINSLFSELGYLSVTHCFLKVAVADPEGVRGGSNEPPLESKLFHFCGDYFHFMGNFRKNWSNCTDRTPLS